MDISGLPLRLCNVLKDIAQHWKGFQRKFMLGFSSLLLHFHHFGHKLLALFLVLFKEREGCVGLILCAIFFAFVVGLSTSFFWPHLMTWIGKRIILRRQYRHRLNWIGIWLLWSWNVASSFKCLVIQSTFLHYVLVQSDIASFKDMLWIYWLSFP